MTNEPNDFDDFATHIHSDELIPDGYEPDGYEDRDCDEPTDPEYVKGWDNDYYGDDDGFYEEFPW